MNPLQFVSTPKAGKCFCFLDATKIKFIAAFLMLLDHVHQMFAYSGAPLWLTMLGRPVFPMFLFLAADSFHYTRNRRKYLLRLLLASWFMTVSSLLLQRILPNDNIVLMNNAFSTFFVAAIYMYAWDYLKEGFKLKRLSSFLKAAGLALLPMVGALPLLMVGALSADVTVPLSTIRLLASLALLFPNLLAVEGGAVMVLLGLLFYICRERRYVQVTILLLLSALLYLRSPADIQWMMGFAAIFMLMYNGEKGSGAKYFFYSFYPVHIYVLYVAACLLV